MTIPSSHSHSNGVEARFRSPDRVVDGVPSFTTLDNSSDLINADRLGRLVEVMDTKPLYRALDDALAGYDDRDRFLKRVFRPGAESWRILVADAISGSCLDLDASFGTRSLLFAELDGVDEVYSVDDQLDPLRFLAKRSDYETADSGHPSHGQSRGEAAAPVYPIHADSESLPVPDRAFDTVVVDLAAISQWGKTRRRVTHAAKFVEDGGTLIAPIDGPARLTGLTRLLGIETMGTQAVNPELRDRIEALRATPARYRSLFEELGFDDVEFYALVPSTDDPQYGFALSEPAAVTALLDLELSGDGIVNRLIRQGTSLEPLVDVLQRGYPSYVAVGRRSGTAQTGDSEPRLEGSTPDGGLVVRGRSRSIIVEHDDDGTLKQIRKIPHRRAHAPFVLNERVVADHIENTPTESWIKRTFPDGHLERSRFGPAYVEPIASGIKMSRFISDDPAAFQHVLEVGFDWITEFQQSYRGEDRHLTGDEIREDLSCESLTPPQVPSSLDLFVTPSHGDFQPGNIYLDTQSGGRSTGRPFECADEVSQVIDWEFATVDGNPITDPAFLVIWTIGIAFEDHDDGLERALVQDTTYSEIVSDVVGRYCDAVGLEPIVFQTYLPYVWIRRTQHCEETGATMHYTGHSQKRVERVEFFWEHLDEIGETLMG